MSVVCAREVSLGLAACKPAQFLRSLCAHRCLSLGHQNEISASRQQESPPHRVDKEAGPSGSPNEGRN